MSDATVARTGITDRTIADIREVLSGKMRWRSPLLFAGPAVIASIAYMDPGNFATNIQAGSKYGYALLWVVLVANVTAMLYQALSAKLGIVTGRNLAEMCRDHFPKPVVWALWIVSEAAAMATDVAEFLGAAIGLALLLHIPLLAGMGIAAVLTYGILTFQGRGFRPIEIIIGALIMAIALCYLAEMFIAPVDWRAAGLGTVVPQFPDGAALTIAVGIVGATIMPHAIFLHSGLTQNRAPARNDRERRQLLRFSNIEVVIALGVAGLINMAMVIMAASAFHEGHSDVAEIETAYRTLTPLLGAGAAGAFLTALLASGLSSSAVGTMAGQMIMQGFVGFRIPIIVRRLVTMIPAFVVVWLGVNSTTALVMSQVVLSIALPAPVIALLIFTRRKDIMGAFANSRLTNVAAVAGADFDPDPERLPAAADLRRRYSGPASRLRPPDWRQSRTFPFSGKSNSLPPTSRVDEGRAMSLTRKASSTAKKAIKPPRQDPAAALAEREAELAEARQQQAATAEILRVISQSPTDARPVFERIVVAAARLLRCDMAFVLLREADAYVHTAGATPEGPMADLAPEHFPIDASANFPSRAFLAKTMLHLPDWSQIDLPEHERHIHELFGINSAFYLPMLRDDECIGVLVIAGGRPNSFGPSEIAHAETFRDQALIAIENARLFNETQEALEQQKASAEVLGAISKSIADASPVFETILDACQRLFGSEELGIYTIGDDEMVRVAAWRGPRAEEARQDVTPLADSVTGRVIRERRPHHIPDLGAVPNLSPTLRDRVNRHGGASLLYAPMVREDSGLGSIA